MAASARLKTSRMDSPGFHCTTPPAAVSFTWGKSGFSVNA
jgi:hypothetical protein